LATYGAGWETSTLLCPSSTDRSRMLKPASSGAILSATTRYLPSRTSRSTPHRADVGRMPPDLAFGPTQRRDEVIGRSVTRASRTYEGDVTAVGDHAGRILQRTARKSERIARAKQLDVNVGIVVVFAPRHMRSRCHPARRPDQPSHRRARKGHDVGVVLTDSGSPGRKEPRCRATHDDQHRQCSPCEASSECVARVEPAVSATTKAPTVANRSPEFSRALW